MQALADKVWGNPAFHAAASRLQRAWLAYDIGVNQDGRPDLEEVVRIVQASAILACSDISDHREQAYRSMTSAFDLYGISELPLDQAARVVLARLVNFPAMATRLSIRDALANLPASLITEEFAVSDRRYLVANATRPNSVSGLRSLGCPCPNMEADSREASNDAFGAGAKARRIAQTGEGR